MFIGYPSRSQQNRKALSIWSRANQIPRDQRANPVAQSASEELATARISGSLQRAHVVQEAIERLGRSRLEQVSETQQLGDREPVDHLLGHACRQPARQSGVGRPVRSFASGTAQPLRFAARIKWPGFTWIGAGIAAYGGIYFGFHDVSSTAGCATAMYRVRPI